MGLCFVREKAMHHNPQAQAYKSLFPQARLLSTDFTKLEKRVMDKLLANPNCAEKFKEAVRTGQSYSYHVFDDYKQGVDVMPRRVYSFDPAMNNKVITSRVQTLADLQEVLDNNPSFTHISCVQDGKHWLIHKGPVSAKSSTAHGKWKAISVKRLPKPIRMLLVIDPLMG